MELLIFLTWQSWLNVFDMLIPNIAWVSINDPGVSGYEGFTGEMSKYGTINV